MRPYDFSKIGRQVALKQIIKPGICLLSHWIPYGALSCCPYSMPQLQCRLNELLLLLPKLLLMLKKSDGRLHLNLETLKLFYPPCLLSFCLQPVHSITEFNFFVEHPSEHTWTEIHLQSFIHAPTLASLQTSIDQNQGNDIFCCPHTLDAITVVSIFISWHFRTLYWSRREMLASRSNIDFWVQLYTWAWC